MKEIKRIHVLLTVDEKILLRKLAKLHDRSASNLVKTLIIKEAKEYGLIEARGK